MNEYITGLKVNSFIELNVTQIELYTQERGEDGVVEVLIDRVYIPTSFLKEFFILKKKCYSKNKETIKQEDFNMSI